MNDWRRPETADEKQKRFNTYIYTTFSDAYCSAWGYYNQEWYIGNICVRIFLRLRQIAQIDPLGNAGFCV